MTSLSQTLSNGSGRRRTRGVFFCEGSRGSRAETGFRGSDRNWVGLSKLHEKPHLMVGDMATGQRIGPPKRKTDPSPGTAIVRQAVSRCARGCWHNYARASPSLRRASTPAIRILIAAGLSPCWSPGNVSAPCQKSQIGRSFHLGREPSGEPQLDGFRLIRVSEAQKYG